MYRPLSIVRTAVSHTLAAWTLLFLLPFVSLHMICVGGGTTAAAEPASAVNEEAAAVSHEPADCATYCPHRPRPQTEEACVIVADPACALLVGSTGAVMPVQIPLPSDRIVVRVAPLVSQPYDAPNLARPGPPPKALPSPAFA